MNYDIDKKCKIAYVKSYGIKNLHSEDKLWNKIVVYYKYVMKKIIEKKAGTNLIYEIPLQFNTNEMHKSGKIEKYQQKKTKKEESKNNTTKSKKSKREKEIIKIIENLEENLLQQKIDGIVLSEEISEILDEYKINLEKSVVLDGKVLMKNTVIDVLEKVLEKREEELQLSKVYILVEKYNRENLDILYDLAKKVKNINIITSNIALFRKLENELYENYGTAVSVMNNKKKSLKRAELVINFDFNFQLLKKYVINRNAVLINCQKENIDFEVGFDGVVINSAEYVIPSSKFEYFEIYDIYHGFDEKKLYESLIFNKTYDKMCKQKSKDNISIDVLIGNRGVINSMELLKTKSKDCFK